MVCAKDIQAVTNDNCPTSRTSVVDARDNRTYFIRKLADNRCWMLTNLAYAGGGDNAYGDVIPIGTGSGGTLSGPDNSGVVTYVLAKYYTHDSANPTVAPTQPSTSTNGGTTSPQYGYLYNWPAAVAVTGVNPGAHGSTPTPENSICPYGWMLPANGSDRHLAMLNAKMNNPAATAPMDIGTTSYIHNWRPTGAFKGVFAGLWSSGFSNQGDSGFGYLWTRSIGGDSSALYPLIARFSMSTFSTGSGSSAWGLYNGGQSIRCLLR